MAQPTTELIQMSEFRTTPGAEHAAVLGVDCSTQSTKVEVRDLMTGRVLATGGASHPPTEPPVSEQDPESWWLALVAACEQLGDVRSRVVAVAVAGQQHGLVVLGEDGEPLRPAKLWNDTTSAPQAERLVGQMSADAWAAGCGSVPVASFTITKLAWLAEHEPGVLERTTKVMLPHDYLTWRLTGTHVTDRGDASGTGWFDPRANEYRPDLLAVAAPSDWLERLPQVLAPRVSAGELRPEAAAQLGLPAGATVAPGTGDNMGAALGLGLGEGDLAVSLGTSGTVYAVSATGTADASGAVAGFADATGRFLPLVCTLNATKVTEAVARWLGTDVVGLGEMALAAADGSPGPVMVPYLDGERTPNLPGASGLLTGLRTSTDRRQLALAAHDGVICGLLDGVDALRDAGVDIGGRTLLVGGGARSPAYRQRAADLLGHPVEIPEIDEAVAAGAALQAAMVVTSAEPTELAGEWGFRSSQVVDPVRDGSSVRSAYASARRLAAEAAASPHDA